MATLLPRAKALSPRPSGAEVGRVTQVLTDRVARCGALACGLALLAVAVVVNSRATLTRGEDFDSLYVIARSVLIGFDVYTAPDLTTVFGSMKG
ncbi:MAG: hypothetical protein JOZ81_34965, partial [Chloroflexi bacterium]|nr:hypothetical protein [Chloroflexota bacterium]